ncbi:putative nuclease, contains PIN domain, potential toxin-antitoxin system component [Candidatus Fervidibacteria bacterium JGI MDM2 JNZ-1-D12]
MKLLCDECIPRGVVEILRASGFDALWTREVLPPNTPDAALLRWSYEHKCILVTCDVQDFGELIFRGGQKAFGVILLRGVQNEPEKMAERLMQVLRERGERLEGYFTTVTPKQVRQRKLLKHC